MRDPAGGDDALSRDLRHAGRRGRGRDGDPPLLLGAAGARGGGGRARLVLLVRRQRHLSEGRRPARGGAPGPRRAAPGRDRLAVPGAAVGARQAEPARQRRRGRRAAGRGARRPYDGAGANSSRRTRAGLPSGEARARTSSPTPTCWRRSFATPTSIPATWCSRSAAGRARSRERLAPRVAHLHVIELDRRLADELEAVAGAPPERLGRAGATRCGSISRALEPAPTAVVSNLPYSIATPVLLRTIAELPEVAAWTVMVQREIADRLRASPGSRTYGAPSVLVQLACEVELLRTVDRAVFRPRPRVDSALLRLERARPRQPPPALARLVRDAFAHRRKPLAGSLELAGGPSREAVRAALERPRPRRRGSGRGARARRLRRSSRSAWRSVDAPRAGQAQPLPLPGPAPRRRPARDSLAVLPADARRPDRGLGRRRGRGGLPRRRGAEPGAGGARRRFAPAAGARSPARVEIEKRIPVAAGLGGGSADAAALLRLARDEVDGLAELAAELGADVPSQLDPAFALVGGAGEAVEPLPPPGEFAAVLLPAEDGPAHRRRLRGGRSPRPRPRPGRAGRDRREAARRRGRRAPRRSTTPSCWSTTWRRRRCRCGPRSARRSRRSRRPGRRWRWSPGRARRPSGCSRTSSPPTGPPTALPPRYAGAIVAAPETSR